MANQVKTQMQNYFEKVLYENLTFEIPPQDSITPPIFTKASSILYRL